jgi:hypothetical protein
MFIQHARKILLGACVFLLLHADSATAQLSISPNVVEGRTYPGGVWTFSVGVMNVGNQVLSCTTEVYAMEVLGSGMPVPVDQSPRSCSGWITALNERFELEPKEGKRLLFRVRTPREVSGGYYAVVSLTGRPPESTVEKGEGGVSASVRFGHRGLVPILITVPGADLRAVIEAAVPGIGRGPNNRGFSIRVPVRNTGNIHARMSGSVEVRSHAGQLVDRLVLSAGRGFVLPDHERLLESDSTLNLPDGAYVAKINLNVEKGRRPMQNAFPFVVRSGVYSMQEITDELLAELDKQSAGFTLSPGMLTIDMPPGARRVSVIEIMNLTRDTLRLIPQGMEWSRLQDGKDLVLEEEPAHGRSGRRFLDLTDEIIEIRPLSRRRLPVIVSLPKGVAGEAYCAVLLEREDLQLDASAAGRVRRSVKMRIQAGETEETSAKITEFEVHRAPNGAVSFIAEIENTGNWSLVPDVTFHLRDGRGNVIARARPTERSQIVQAGGRIRLELEYDKVVDPGAYDADISVRFDPGKPVITKRSKFEIAVEPAPASPADASKEERMQ